MQTNTPSGANAVNVLVASKGGKFKAAGKFRTGRSGTGKPIPSQGTMGLTRDRRFLAVLSVGSSTVTVFRIGKGRLERTARRGSGGHRPVSIASGPHNQLVVLNAGSTARLAGFRVRRKSGKLVPLPHFSAPLAKHNASGAYQVALSPSGRRAAVSYAKAKGGKDLELFRVAAGHLKSSRVVGVRGGRPSPVSFLSNNRLLVGRMASSGLGIATYGIGQGLQNLSAIAASSCWIENNVKGTLGWATSPSSVNAFGISSSGGLRSLRSTQLRGRTSDLALGQGGRRLYVLNKRHDRVRVLALDPQKLTVIGSSHRLPGTSTGIVDLPNNIGGF